MTPTWADRQVTDPQSMAEFQRERLVLEVTELICMTMREKSLTRNQLAEKLGKSKSYITQLLDGRTNMTLATIANVMLALDACLEVDVKPISVLAGKGTCESLSPRPEGGPYNPGPSDETPASRLAA